MQECPFCHSFSTSYWQSSTVCFSAIKLDKEIKCVHIERKKKTLFADNMIVNVENPKELTKNFLELISNYSKVVRYKVSIQKPNTFLYVSNEKNEIQN